jgi:hypothetical protein
MTLAGSPAPARDPTVPELLRGAAVVALIPATGDLDRAGALAWEVARLAAGGGRRVALVDCFVDEPRLHAVAGESNDEGIVDVFEYGASLSRIAVPQAEPGLFFVPAGTYFPDPPAIMAHPRWRRLSAGFRHEQALLLLFAPPECLADCAAGLDGMMALAPDGVEVGLASTPEIQAAVDAGLPLIASMTEMDGAIAEEQEPSAPAARRIPGRRALQVSLDDAIRRRRRRWAAYGVVVVLGAVAAAVYLVRGGGRPAGPGADTVTRSSAAAPPAGPAPAPRAVRPLPIALQASSWPTLPLALAAADSLESGGYPPIIAPIRVGGKLWYRVYVGPVATVGAADSLRQALRAAGFDRGGAATPATVPLSFALGHVARPGEARAERSRLRELGIPAFILCDADGSYRLLAGAYGAPGQAAYLDSLLNSTGHAGPLGPRVGSLP